MRSLQLSILPKRWNIIRSLEVHWQWADFSTSPHSGCGYYRRKLYYQQDIWKRGCQTIKTLKALRHFTVVPHFTSVSLGMVYLPGNALKIVEPLKDLRLKDPWELRIPGSEEDIKSVDASLKEAGFDCFVTRLKK
jgi:hypothetical protein